MNSLFETTDLGALRLPNRFVRSATWEGLAAPDGSPTESLINVATDLAQGGVGLIVTGHAFVAAEGRAGPRQLGVHDDDVTPALGAMTAAVHEAGGLIALQLAHAGLRAVTGEDGGAPLGPSAMQLPESAMGREMTGDDLQAVTRAFAAAARRAQATGFDAVQLHAAHGYLLSEFLSPFFNKRTDAYGGDIRNRARLVVEVLRAVRGAVGHGFPVFAKLNAEDFLPGGFTVEDMLETAAMLGQAGIDAVELSGGTYLSGEKKSMRRGCPMPGDPEAYYEAAARRFKEELDIPLMLVGGIRTLETAERLVAEGVTDYISLSRPLIREPGLVNRWKSGDRRPALCISDNRCFVRALKGRGVECAYLDR